MALLTVVTLTSRDFNPENLPTAEIQKNKAILDK
jgi:hypothetical protein